MAVGLRICVFCSSSDGVGKVYFDAATELGLEIAGRGHSLVFGGGKIGLMGAVARAVHQGGGKVMGVMPSKMQEWQVGYDQADDMILTENMHDRKAIMEQNADGFIALPGGIGTFEELLEIITLKQLHYHVKPIVILNIGGYYDPLLQLMDSAVSGKFMKPETTNLYTVCASPMEALDHIEGYVPPTVVPKFFVDLLLENERDAALE